MASDYIVAFYAGNDLEVASYFRSLLRFYCMLLFVDFIVWFLFSTSRSLGLINKTLAINLTFTLAVHMIVSSGLAYAGIRHCFYFIANMYFQLLVAFVLVLALILRQDWSTIYKSDREEDEAGRPIVTTKEDQEGIEAIELKLLG